MTALRDDRDIPKQVLLITFTPLILPCVLLHPVVLRLKEIRNHCPAEYIRDDRLGETLRLLHIGLQYGRW